MHCSLIIAYIFVGSSIAEYAIISAPQRVDFETYSETRDIVYSLKRFIADCKSAQLLTTSMINAIQSLTNELSNDDVPSADFGIVTGKRKRQFAAKILILFFLLLKETRG